MPVFTGTSEHAIDSKLRLSIPAKHRAQLDAARDGNVWYGVPWPVGTIRLYTKADYEELSAKGRKQLVPDRDTAELALSFHATTELLEMDAQGRVGLPRTLIEDGGLAGVTDVVIAGAGGWLEIRDRAAWQAARRERINSLPELVARLNARGMHE